MGSVRNLLLRPSSAGRRQHQGVVVGEGDTFEEALADVKSAIRFHLKTFGKQSFKMESPLFQLRVPTNSILNQLQDEPLKPGTYYAVIGGYFLLIKKLPKSKYCISFGAEGPGEYSTRSIYDIEVYSAASRITKDVSGHFQNLKPRSLNLVTK